MSTNHRTTTIVAIGLLSALALTGCTINYGEPESSSGMGGMMSDENSTEFSAVDIMFAQMMIPHHEQAIEMSDLALERSVDSEILTLAQQIKDAQTPEIEQMTGWIESAGSGMTMNHDMGMDGMLSDNEMQTLRSATGAEFDRLYLEGMIQHHEGAITMAAMITDSENAEARALADAIISSQTAEIATMRALLAR